MSKTLGVSVIGVEPPGSKMQRRRCQTVLEVSRGSRIEEGARGEEKEERTSLNARPFTDSSRNTHSPANLLPGKQGAPSVEHSRPSSFG